jgi:hypothetical protein
MWKASPPRPECEDGCEDRYFGGVESEIRYWWKGKLTGRTVRRRARAAIITPAVIFLVFISV